MVQSLRPLLLVLSLRSESRPLNGTLVAVGFEGEVYVPSFALCLRAGTCLSWFSRDSRIRAGGADAARGFGYVVAARRHADVCDPPSAPALAVHVSRERVSAIAQ